MCPHSPSAPLHLFLFIHSFLLKHCNLKKENFFLFLIIILKQGKKGKILNNMGYNKYTNKIKPSVFCIQTLSYKQTICLSKRWKTSFEIVFSAVSGSKMTHLALQYSFFYSKCTAKCTILLREKTIEHCKKALLKILLGLKGKPRQCDLSFVLILQNEKLWQHDHRGYNKPQWCAALCSAACRGGRRMFAFTRLVSGNKFTFWLRCCGWKR